MYDKLKNIKALVMDVDGVLSDGRIFLDSNGEWKRSYNVKDGVGIKLLKERGYYLGLITGAKANDVEIRGRFLGIDHIYLGALEKEPSFQDFCLKLKLDHKQIAYIGDDIYDIPLIKMAGFGVTVPDAFEEVKAYADYVTKVAGGCGAVRELADLILKWGSYSV